MVVVVVHGQDKPFEGSDGVVRGVGYRAGGCLFVDLGQDFRVAEQVVFVLADLDGATAVLQAFLSVSSSVRRLCRLHISGSARELHRTYLRDQDLVARLDTHGYSLALAIEATGTDGQDLGFVQLLDAGLGQEDAAGRLGLGFDALDQNAVEEGGERADGFQGGGLGRELMLV